MKQLTSSKVGKGSRRMRTMTYHAGPLDTEQSVTKEKLSQRKRRRKDYKMSSQPMQATSPKNLPLSQPQVRPPVYYRRPIILVWVGLVKLLLRVMQASFKMLEECLDSTTTLEVRDYPPSLGAEKPKQNSSKQDPNPNLMWWITK